MKIVQTPIRFAPAIGGVEKYVLDLSTELVQQGHEVSVICANEPKAESGKVNGITVKRLWYLGKVANTNITPKLIWSLWKEDCDIIHTHIPTPWSADLSAITSIIRNKPLVVTYHNDIIKTGAAGAIAAAYNHTLLKLVLWRADKIIITSPEYLHRSKYLQPYKKKIQPIPLGIQFDSFTPAKSQKAKQTVFFLSVLDSHHRYKGLDILLEAMSILKRSIPDIELNIGGDGELRAEYESLARKKGLDKNVHFLGRLTDEELRHHYKKSTVFVLPSVNNLEGFGIVLLEAMAHETPVVASDSVGVARDIVTENCGLVVKRNDAKALARAIQDIITNRSLAKTMGKNGRKLVKKKYNWREIAREFDKTYRGLQ